MLTMKGNELYTVVDIFCLKIFFSKSKQNKNLQKNIQYNIDFSAFFKIDEFTKNTNKLKSFQSADTKITADKNVLLNLK